VKSQNVPVETLFGVGNPVKFMIEKAKARDTSMFVVGVQGLHRLGKVRALGSTSRRLIESSPIPVVTVP
jgi:nucleotide-binding universal stress UspA family protein